MPIMRGLPNFWHIFTIGLLSFLKSLKISACTYTCANHKKNEKQQPAQNPCQNALTIKTKSCLANLLLNPTLSQTHFLSHSWTMIFQLPIFSLMWGEPSMMATLQWSILVQSWVAGLYDRCDMCTDKMPIFHAEQYLKRIRVIARTVQAKIYKPEVLGWRNYGDFMYQGVRIVRLAQKRGKQIASYLRV